MYDPPKLTHQRHHHFLTIVLVSNNEKKNNEQESSHLQYTNKSDDISFTYYYSFLTSASPWFGWSGCTPRSEERISPHDTAVSKLSFNVEMYGILQTHAEMRRVQEMLYAFILQNGGRLIKSVPGRTGYYYVLSRHAAMTVMARMLYEGPNVVEIDATLPIGIFPVDDDINDDDDDDDDDDLNVTEAYRQFQNS